ncbi:hypothetical protein K4K60_005976 [Colletotrichum sp. SAR11_57]|nr:hypothetical protein K4K60_005976 [Colletotrichum sp. SAR11_57]
MASGGLYPTPTPSWFTLADRHHLERVLDVSGYSDGLPDYFDRSKRYDRQPGDPLDRMFAALPTPADDEKVTSPDVKLEKGIADYNRRFVLALWPYANSSLQRVVQISSDPNAHDYWWLTRFAFSLHERSDLSIRCTFSQLLGQLAVSGTIPVSPAPVAADELSVPADPDVKRKLLAWDATDNIYYHLQGLIYLILAPHCDAIVEMTVLSRNAEWIASTAGDISRETNEFQTSKGKDPMFWPRPILSCHIRGASTEEGVYVIDLLGSKVGHEHIVLPYDAYVKSRHVSCLSSVPLYPTKRWVPHPYPVEQKGLVVTRDGISEALRSSIMRYFAQHWADMKGPGHLAKLKDEPYEVYLQHFLKLIDKILEDATAKSRAAGHCQRYLHHDPNPYSHEYTIGMTWREAEVSVYKNVWMKANAHKTIMGTISEQNKRLPAGSETRRLVLMWIDRLVKHRQKHPFDAADILGSKLSKHYNLAGDFGLEETRAIESSFLQWSGVPKREVERFFTFCEKMLGGNKLDGPITPELFRTLTSPNGAMDFMKNMTPDEAQMFLGIGHLMMSPNASDTIEHLQAKLHGLNIAKK